jgi:putative DNA methylase
LIEVSLPLEAINKESAREKSIRHGHPSTLHLWWARRPLAACRAVLFAQLVDDPSAHPDRFPTEEDQTLERKRLHNIIERLVVWENANDEALLKEARAEIWKSCGGNPPPILDPFAGGGSIPLEAQRLGLEAHASDLNPVAVLINKALIEIPPKWAGLPPVFPGAASVRIGGWPAATGLAEDVRRYGHWMRDEAEKRIGHLYPKVTVPGEEMRGGKRAPDTEATVIAWIWARTVRCPNPACGTEIPLLSTMWLSKKKDRPTWLIPIVEKNRVEFEIITGDGAAPSPNKVGRGANFRCWVCGDVCPADITHRQLDSETKPLPRLIAIVAEGNRRRIYLRPDDFHRAAAGSCIDQAADLIRQGSVPAESARGTFGGNAQGRRYGFRQFFDYFTPRQLVAHAAFVELVNESRRRVRDDAHAAGLAAMQAEARGASVATYLAFAESRLIDYGSTMATWMPDPKNEGIRNTFARQAISMSWDFGEANPFSASSGNWDFMVRGIARVLDNIVEGIGGYSLQANAAELSLAERIVVCTDPPYYDNIGYSDLADYFYVWLRRSIGHVYPDVTRTMLTPKDEELIASPYRFNGNKSEADRHFEDGFIGVFNRIRSSHTHGFPIAVFYAFKQAENDDMDGVSSTGWETMLEGLMKAGLEVNATWPMRTERTGRSVGVGTNALASSIVLACRPRAEFAGTTDRRGLIAVLREELPDALRKLQEGNIAPVDLAQAAIGPGMGVFSGYAQVAEPDGSPMRVRTALALINQVLAEVLTEQEGDLDADSRFALKWFEQYCWDEGLFGTAETLAKAMNTSVSGLERSGIFWARAGKARLITPEEMPTNHDPINDQRIPVWEVVLHLVKRLDTQGIDAAGRFMAEAGGRLGDLDAVKELAYLLFAICERKKWSKQALRFNNLVTAWSDVDKEARRTPVIRTEQATLDFDSLTD